MKPVDKPMIGSPVFGSYSVSGCKNEYFQPNANVFAAINVPIPTKYSLLL